MFAKSMTAGVIGSALLASVAFAQTPTTTTDRATPAPVAASDSSHQGQWRASKLVGLSVYNESNESLGSINDLLTDASGNIQAVVIGVGGFLGVGEHLVAVPYDKIKFSDQPVVTTSASWGGAGGMSNSSTTTSSTTTSSTTTTGAATSAPAATSKNPWYPDHAVFGASKDELKAMPEFKYST
jgi:sporulation protein YlmC with PRC-barrel domain